ncbi:MAG: hypothetical protein IPI67_14255 [Myxococcales bacterium]|nr:hypothetical protein [Myxococcales bacterium]
MREPKRLIDGDPSSLGARLLRGGRQDLPDRKRVDRIFAGLVGAGGALVSGAGGATALSTWSIAQWLAAGAIGGVVATSALFSLEHPPEASTAAAPAVSLPREAPEAIPVLPGGAPEVSASSTPEPFAAPTPPPRPVRRFARIAASDPVVPASSTTAVPAQSTLGAEAATLAAAKAALDRRSAGEALATLRAYRARFPRGELGQEASYLEMEAELASGNRAAAQGIAASLADGTTPSADRAREVLKGRQP